MVEPSSIPIPNPSKIPNASPKNRRQTRSESTGSTEQADRRRTESEQQIYSSKLINRVRSLRRADSAAATVRAVRDTADRVLVDSAKGKTHWSRAMLNRRLKKKHSRASAVPDSGFRKPMIRKKPPRLQRKVRVLSRLVPGCRKLSVPSLLEETTDYIAALEMQVKAMALLTAFINGAVVS